MRDRGDRERERDRLKAVCIIKCDGKFWTFLMKNHKERLLGLSKKNLDKNIRGTIRKFFSDFRRPRPLAMLLLIITNLLLSDSSMILIFRPLISLPWNLSVARRKSSRDEKQTTLKSQVTLGRPSINYVCEQLKFA